MTKSVPASHRYCLTLNIFYFESKIERIMLRLCNSLRISLNYISASNKDQEGRTARERPKTPPECGVTETKGRNASKRAEQTTGSGGAEWSKKWGINIAWRDRESGTSLVRKCWQEPFPLEREWTPERKGKWRRQVQMTLRWVWQWKTKGS